MVGVAGVGEWFNVWERGGACKRAKVLRNVFITCCQDVSAVLVLETPSTPTCTLCVLGVSFLAIYVCSTVYMRRPTCTLCVCRDVVLCI